MFHHMKWRLVYLAAGIATFLFVYFSGASFHMSSQEARDVLQQIGTKNRQLDQLSIFLNNVKPALGMFIPAFGVGLGIYSAFSTGMVFNAAAIIYPALKGVSPLTAFLTPFAVMEVFSYGLAMSRSGMLVYLLIKRRSYWRQYAVHTAIEIAIVVVILLIGSVVEWQNIQHQHQQQSNR